MWKIFHKLFGWHYVWIKDCDQGHICRVSLMPNGELMGKIVAANFFITRYGKISGGYWIMDWKPLTWDESFPSKQQKDL